MSRRKEPSIPNELLDQLLAGGAASAAFDQGGLLDSPKKALTERALNAEMDHHLAGEDGAGNMRNGYGRKTVMTETGKLAIDVPRDRQSSFDPQLIAKYQRRFPGFDDKIVSMYARGMSTREITALTKDILERIAALYAIEAEVRGAPSGMRQKARQERTKPLIAELRNILDDAHRRFSPNSVMATAIAYGTKCWTALTRFLDNGQLEIDNNIAERSLRAARQSGTKEERSGMQSFAVVVP